MRTRMRQQHMQGSKRCSAASTNNSMQLRTQKGAVQLPRTTAYKKVLNCTRACASTLTQATKHSHAYACAPTTHARVKKAQCSFHPLQHAITQSDAHTCAPKHSRKQPSAHMHTRMRQQHTRGSERRIATSTHYSMKSGTQVHTRVRKHTHASNRLLTCIRARANNTRKGQKGAVQLPPTAACNHALRCTRACASTFRQATERSHAYAHTPTTHARVRKVQCSLCSQQRAITRSDAHARAPALSGKQPSAHMHTRMRQQHTQGSGRRSAASTTTACNHALRCTRACACTPTE
jgi:hypothetical protein